MSVTIDPLSINHVSILTDDIEEEKPILELEKIL